MTRYSRLLLASFLVTSLPALGGCYTDSVEASVVFSGELSTSNESFTMNGTLVDTAPTTDWERFENLGIYLYDEERALIQSVDVGSFQREEPVEIRAVRVPTYVIVYSPDFWEHGLVQIPGDDVEVAYYERTGEHYREDLVSERGDLPVVPRESPNASSTDRLPKPTTISLENPSANE